jgi:branched-subunit amino acid transport protein
MTSAGLLLFILAAALGTALIRYLPARYAHHAADPRLARLLQGVPAAALGALLVTGFNSALPPHHLALTAVALAVAAVLAWRPGGVLWPVLGSVSVAAIALALHVG